MHEKPQPMQEPSNRIALFGTFDVENYGDCLFPLIVEHLLTKRLEHVKLYPFSPTDRTSIIGNYPRVYGFHELLKVFSDPPAGIIVGGGELVRTEHGLSIYPQLYKDILYPPAFKCWLLPVMIADSWKCPCFLNAVGHAPALDQAFLDLIGTYLRKMSLCLVRDGFTADRFSQMGVQAEVVPDCGFATSHLFKESEWKSKYLRASEEFQLPEKYLVAQISFTYGGRKTHAGFAKAVAETANKTGLPVVLLPISHHLADIQSLKVLRRILNRQNVKCYLINKLVDTLQSTAILANSELYMGTSLHGAVVTLSFGKPALSFSLSKTGKHRGVLSVVGLEICHTNQLETAAEAAFGLLQMPRSYFTEKVETANRRIDDYFGRIATIVKSSPRAAIPEGMSQDPRTGEITYKGSDDFRRITELCLTKKKEITIWKNCFQYLVRQNFTISQHYDHLRFYLPKGMAKRKASDLIVRLKARFA
jgi:polysaccharide pyruvyl transferase WcaK-like protein